MVGPAVLEAEAQPHLLGWYCSPRGAAPLDGDRRAHAMRPYVTAQWLGTASIRDGALGRV